MTKQDYEIHKVNFDKAFKRYQNKTEGTKHKISKSQQQKDKSNTEFQKTRPSGLYVENTKTGRHATIPADWYGRNGKIKKSKKTKFEKAINWVNGRSEKDVK